MHCTDSRQTSHENRNEKKRLVDRDFKSLHVPEGYILIKSKSLRISGGITCKLCATSGKCTLRISVPGRTQFRTSIIKFTRHNRRCIVLSSTKTGGLYYLHFVQMGYDTPLNITVHEVTYCLTFRCQPKFPVHTIAYRAPVM